MGGRERRGRVTYFVWHGRGFTPFRVLCKKQSNYVARTKWQLDWCDFGFRYVPAVVFAILCFKGRLPAMLNDRLTTTVTNAMLRVGLLAWATSCGGLGYAVAADKIEVPGVDHYVEESIILLSRTSEYIITIETWDESISARSRPQIRGKNWTKPREI